MGAPTAWDCSKAMSGLEKIPAAELDKGNIGEPLTKIEHVMWVSTLYLRMTWEYILVHIAIYVYTLKDMYT